MTSVISSSVTNLLPIFRPFHDEFSYLILIAIFLTEDISELVCCNWFAVSKSGKWSSLICS